MEITERNRIINGMFFPFLFVAILWVIKFAEITFETKLTGFGLYPRTYSGLIGIFTFPLLHGDFYHLLSNSVPLLFLGSIIFYFYRGIAFQVFFWVYLMTGVWVWAAGRSSFHIGASGLVYGFVCFLFFSGVFRKNNRLLALSLLVVFVYGSLIWGVLPLRKGISWESHLMGSVAGLITAFYFRKEGPAAKKYEWEDEPEEDQLQEEHPVTIRYIYLPQQQGENNENNPPSIKTGT